jgi:EAL domain-containing protein (putative c-di-GMP-specific phosphodiesterase class I)
LKLDRSFVQRAPSDHTDATISRAVISLAHGLGITVVAEGVETEAQQAFLVAEGCDHAQGYLLGRPVPPGEIVFAGQAAPDWLVSMGMEEGITAAMGQMDALLA